MTRETDCQVDLDSCKSRIEEQWRVSLRIAGSFMVDGQSVKDCNQLALDNWYARQTQPVALAMDSQEGVS